MKTRKQRWLPGVRWLVVVVVALGLAAVPTGPAAAHHAPPPESHDAGGTGSLEGRELVEDQTGFPCFRVTRHLFGLRGAGTYEGRTATGGPVVFRGQIGAGETLYANGPLQVQIENTEPYYHSPFGTHGTEAGGGAGCSPSTVGDSVPAEFRVFAAEGTEDTDGDKDVDVLTGAAWVYRLDEVGAKVPCRAEGSYARGTKGSPSFGDPAEVAEWTLGEDCVVVGNEAGTPGTGTAPRGTFHTHHGVHEPCFGDVMAGDCPRNIRHDYGQFLPKPGPFLTLTGPTSAAIGCERPVTVTARLTVDGLARADVPVTFSVTGPTPAVPPGGAGVTGADGRAPFTFGAAQPGDYTVTVRATYEGQERVAGHTVRFTELPPLSITLAGPTRGQTEEATTVTATVRDACGPLAGATVDFNVAWPPQDTPWTGQATPASGSAITDELGQAPFSFTGDRAGSYTVTATTSLATEQASATYTAHLAINTLKRVGSIPLATEGEVSPKLSVMDPAGAYAYFATGPDRLATKVVKFDLATFQRVGELPLPSDQGVMRSLVIDPGGDYAYAGTPEGVLKLDLRTFQWTGSITVPNRPDGLAEAPVAGVVDPAGHYAYFGINGRYVADRPEFSYPAELLKIDLNTFQVVDTMDMDAELETNFGPALMDPSGASAYFNFQNDVLGARVVKVDLAAFQRAGVTTLNGADESSLGSAVIGPNGDFAYFGTVFDKPGRVVKVNLRTMTRVAAIILAVDRTEFGPYPVDKSEDELFTAVMDPVGRFAYFGTRGRVGSEHPGAPHVPARLIRIELSSFTRAESMDLPPATENDSQTAVIDPAGTHAYLGASQADAVPSLSGQRPGLVAKVRLNRPPSPALTADADAYETDNATPLTVPAPGVLDGDQDTRDNDPLIATQASDPPGGSVALNPDGSFTYTPDAGFAGTDTFTYTASDGADYSAPATVSVAVAPPPGLTATAFGYHSSVSLFGGPYGERGPAPTVALAPDGANSPQDAHLDSAEAVYGPATLFKSGPIDVHAEGAMLPIPGARSSSVIQGYPDPNQRPGPFLYDGVESTCATTARGATASTTVTNGVVETKYDPQSQEPIQTEPVPPQPPPGYTVEGTIDHVGDSFRIVFNEQTANPDGSVVVNAAHMYLLGPTAVGDLVIGQSVCGAPRVDLPKLGAVADFDGDGTSDVGVYRPDTGIWYLRQSSGGDTASAFGTDGDVATPADYDGDAKVDVAVYRPSSGVWYLRQSSGEDTATAFGTEGDVPVPADYDGDAKADVAVYRPSTGVWYLRQSSAGDTAVAFGTDGDIPVVGDYDGDAKADLSVYRPTTGVWYLRQSSAGDTATAFGTDGDIPTVGDYDGDAKADMAVYRPSTGVWYLRQSSAGDTATVFGTQGDVPAPADYDGDGKTDVGVFRPSTGVWYLRQSTAGDTATVFGTDGDVALSVHAAVYQRFF